MKRITYQSATAPSLFAPWVPDAWFKPNQAIITSADIRHPWRSVYGFPLTVAQLATHQKVILHCREDEVFDLMAGLNDLLKNPVHLNGAFTWLQQLEQRIHEKLVRLRQFEAQPLTQEETVELMASAEQLLTEPLSETVENRLLEFLSPDQPAAEINGLDQMSKRLRRWLPVLERVKDLGFQVVVFDRRRQPSRPALEAGRNEVSGLGGLPARFLLPQQYHLTLWAYLVCRSDTGQAGVWN
ncbi:MAG: hypothetical protein HS126_31535 [Anaerolineales bacterium]|nr:hypothetical protein [Anaerolineales bacterium]